MMRRALTLALVLALATCGPPDAEDAGPGQIGEAIEARPGSPEHPAPEDSPSGDPPAGQRPLAVNELPGEYRVAGVDGGEIDLPHAITASVGEQRIHVVSDCVNLAWTYSYDGKTLSTARAMQESCARGLNPVEQAIVATLEGPARVSRTAANGIAIVGAEHQLTIFSQ